MATTVILEVQAKPGTGNDLLARFKELLPDTRSYDGCLGLDTYQDQDSRTCSGARDPAGLSRVLDGAGPRSPGAAEGQVRAG